MTPATETTTWAGATLAGSRYEVRAKLGEGGMGFVWSAHDRNLDTAVVIKAPRRSLLEDPTFAQRFAREIRALVQLQHPHIVKVLDVGEHEGLPFCVLQYLAGGSLEQKRRAAGGKAAPAAPDQLNTWLRDVAEALDFMHQRGFVHRDVKPANILFDASGNVYLSDFGIAKALAESAAGAPQTLLTGAGIVVGTVQFMAPEMLMGKKYDGRVDQYALAVTVYNVLSGQLPFDGPTPAAIVVKQAAQPPRPLHQLCPSVPPAISAAVRRALAKDPAQRFPDCTAFAEAVLAGLSAAPAQTTSSVEPAPSFRVICPSCGRSPRVPATAHGKKVRCPWCKEVFQAIKPSTPAVQPVPGRSAETAVQAETVAPVRRSGPVLEVLPVDVEPAPLVLPTSQPSRETARRQVMAPSIALLVGASLGVVFCAYLAVFWFVSPPPADIDLVILAMIGFGGVGCAAVILGAIQMLRLHWYGMAMAACIVAIPAGGLLLTPFAVWGLVVLCRPQVRTAFYD
jgi:serine/threonine protein kinase